MIPLPYVIGAIVAIFMLGCATGYSNRDGSAKAAAAKAFKAAEAQRVAMQGEIDIISAKYEVERKRVANVNTQRTNTIKEYYLNAPAVDPRCALSVPMYSLLANHVADANVATTGEPSRDLRAVTGPTRTGN